MTSIINLAFEVAASVMGCTPYYMPSKEDNLRYCTGDEATDFVKVVYTPRLLNTLPDQAFLTFLLSKDYCSKHF